MRRFHKLTLLALTAATLQLSASAAAQDAPDPTVSDAAAPDADAPDATAPDAGAGDEASLDCDEAIGQARALEDAGQLLASQTALLTCQASCDDTMRRKCEARLVDLEKIVPSIVLAIRDANGQDLTTAKVSIDGHTVASNALGRAIHLDPGAHRIVVSHLGATASRDIVARVGEQRRTVDLTVTPTVPITPPPSRAAPDLGQANEGSAAPAIAIAGFSVAAAGFIVGGITGGLALTRYGELQDQCASALGCTEDEISGGKALAHVATGSFIVAGIGAAVGIVALLWDTPAESTARAVTPLVGPGFVGIHTRF